MFYREAGDFKTSYGEDQQTFPLKLDRFGYYLILVIAVFAVVAIVFAATTYDSASYSLASGATLHLSAGDDPARWHRVFWALALAVLPIALMFIGGLKAMQSVLLVVSLPVLVVGVLMAVSLVKSLRADHPD